MRGDADAHSLAVRIDAVLPQTQCTRCGYDGCRAVRRGDRARRRRHQPLPARAATATIAALAAIAGPPAEAARSRPAARQARSPSPSSTSRAASAARCASTPVRSTRSSAREAHARRSLPSLCSGCELCVAPCPVDCIAMVDGRSRRGRATMRARRALAIAHAAQRLARDERIAQRGAVAPPVGRRERAATPPSPPRWRAHARVARDAPSAMSHGAGLRSLASALVVGVDRHDAAAGARGSDFSAKLDSRWDFAQAGGVGGAVSRGARPVPGELARGARDHDAARARAGPAAQVRRRARDARRSRARARPRRRARARPLPARARSHVQLGRRAGEGGSAVPPGRRGGRARRARRRRVLRGRRAAHARHRRARVGAPRLEPEGARRGRGARRIRARAAGAARCTTTSAGRTSSAATTATALDYWQKALAVREASNDAPRLKVARWTVARGYRALGRLDDAEAHAARARRREPKAGEEDGYVYEELAEIALARGDRAAAGPWAAKAYALLREDAWLAATEPARLKRLAELGGDAAPAQQAVTPAKRRAIFERLRAANPDPTTELEHATPVRAARRRRAVGAGDRQGREQGDGEAVSRSPTRRQAIAQLGVDGLIPYISSLGLFRNKAKNVVALSEMLVREHGGEVPRDARGARDAAGRRPQDRERRAQRRVRAADDRGRHAHLPRRQPHRPRAGRDVVEVERKLDEVRARRVQAERAPLADPARALRVRRAHAEVPGMRRSATCASIRHKTGAGAAQRIELPLRLMFDARRATKRAAS